MTFYKTTKSSPERRWLNHDDLHASSLRTRTQHKSTVKIPAIKTGESARTHNIPIINTHKSRKCLNKTPSGARSWAWNNTESKYSTENKIKTTQRNEAVVDKIRDGHRLNILKANPHPHPRNAFIDHTWNNKCTRTYVSPDTEMCVHTIIHWTRVSYGAGGFRQLNVYVRCVCTAKNALSDLCAYVAIGSYVDIKNCWCDRHDLHHLPLVRCQGESRARRLQNLQHASAGLLDRLVNVLVDVYTYVPVLVYWELFIPDLFSIVNSFLVFAFSSTCFVF